MTFTSDVKILALFDFDETLTTADTLPAFLAFIQPAPGFYVKVMQALPAILSWKLGFTDNQKAKETLMGAFMRGKTLKELEDISARFAREKMPALWRKEAVEKLKWHLESGHEVYVVTASCETWVKAAMSMFPEVKVLGSRLAVHQGMVSGKLDGENCYGPEKVVRIKAQLSISTFSEIYAYGDSRGDREMLAMAHHPFYRRF